MFSRITSRVTVYSGKKNEPVKAYMQNYRPSLQGNSAYELSQWKGTLHCNVGFHWLSTCPNHHKTQNNANRVTGRSKRNRFSDVIWTSWRLVSPATLMFVHQLDQTNNKENSKALHYWHLMRGIHRSLIMTPERCSNVFRCHKTPLVTYKAHSWRNRRQSVWRPAFYRRHFKYVFFNENLCFLI